MSGRFFHQQSIKGEKAWLDSAVRRLSHVVVGKEQGQEVWTTPPEWWSRECKHKWKNPTSPKEKDTLQTLRDRFTCLEQHLRKENKIPADMEEEITLWKEKQLPKLFFLTHLSCLLGQIINIGQSLNELKVPKNRSPHVQGMLDELLKTVRENFLKTEASIKNQINQTDSELQFEAECGRLLRKRPMQGENMSKGPPLVSRKAKRPKISSALSSIPLHSPGSLSSSGVSTDGSPCNDTSDDIKAAENSLTSETFLLLDSTAGEKDIQDILSQLSPTNPLVQSTNSGLRPELHISENPVTCLAILPDCLKAPSFEGISSGTPRSDPSHSVTHQVGELLDADFNNTFYSGSPSVENGQSNMLRCTAKNSITLFSDSGCDEMLNTNFESLYVAYSATEQSRMQSSKTANTTEPFVDNTSSENAVLSFDLAKSSVNPDNLTPFCLGDSSQTAYNDASWTPSLSPSFNSATACHKPDTTSDRNIILHHRQAEVSQSLSVSSNRTVEGDDANSQLIINSLFPELLDIDVSFFLDDQS